MRPKAGTKCDICGKVLVKGIARRHHFVPSKLRTTTKDQKDTIWLCADCHNAFHDNTLFSDVSGRSKAYFKKRYLEYRASYQNEIKLFVDHQKEKEDKKNESINNDQST